jgi:hypothetical protein
MTPVRNYWFYIILYKTPEDKLKGARDELPSSPIPVTPLHQLAVSLTNCIAFLELPHERKERKIIPAAWKFF